MSLNPARMSSLADKHEALEVMTEKEKEEAKIKSSKKPAPSKLKDK